MLNYQFFRSAGIYAKTTVSAGSSEKYYVGKSEKNGFVFKMHAVYVTNYKNSDNVTIQYDDNIKDVIPAFVNKAVKINLVDEVTIENNGTTDIEIIFVDEKLAKSGIDIINSISDFAVQSSNVITSNNHILSHFDFSVENEGSETGLDYTKTSGVKYTALSKFGDAAINIASNTDGIKIEKDSFFDLSQDFTIDFWFYTTNPQTNDSVIMRLYDTSNPQDRHVTLTYGVSSGTDRPLLHVNTSTIYGQNRLNTSQYTHLAVSKNGDTYKVSAKGYLKEGTIIYAPTLDGLCIGGVVPETGMVACSNFLIDELRVRWGDGLYYADFTPPSTPYT